MSSPVDVIAVISPNADKVDRVLSIFQELAKNVETHEPGCLKYRLLKQANGSGVPDFVIIEQYANQQAWEHHIQTPYLLEAGKTFAKENLLNKPLEIKDVIMTPIAGFEERA